MHHCLTKKELIELIDFKASGVGVTDDSLRLWIENAESWQDELSGLSYLFSHIIEARNKKGEDCLRLISVLYALEDEMMFTLQEFDYKFVDYLLKNIRNTSLSLEDELVELQGNLSAHAYGKTLRYRY